jgi:hypothetical protein
MAGKVLQTTLDQRLYAEIKAFASEHAGFDIDLDEDLERAQFLLQADQEDGLNWTADLADAERG